MAIVAQFEDTIEPWNDTDAEMLANFALYNVRDGCAVTYSGANMNATVAAGNITHNGATVAVAGGSVTLVADGTNPRWTWIYADSSGTPGMSAGTAAADPSKPELGDNVALALVKVEAGQTIANNIAYKLDKRIMNPVSTSDSQVRKSADESVTSSATLQNDNELSLAVAANKTYVFDVYLAYTAGTTGDFKAALTFPSGATAFAAISATDGSSWTTTGLQISSGGSVSGGGLGVTIPVLQRWTGVLMVSSTAGTLQVQWAQNTSNGTATTVKAGSVMMLR